jgi:hypothetical protein
MTKSQEIYERVEALVADGMKKAEAFKQLAEEYGQPVGSLRGMFYTYSKAAVGNTEVSRTPRRRETTPADALEAAKRTLERAIEAIDREVTAARQRASEAQAEFEALRDSAETRKEAIQTKIAALDA